MSTSTRFLRSRRRSGMVAVYVALSLTMLFGVMAIALDGSILLAERRHAQATADAAALAAAAELFKGSSGTASTSALNIASANGYANDSTNSIVTVRIAGQYYFSGPNQGGVLPAGYAEVSVQFNQQRSFSNIWGTGPTPVRSRAVARGLWTSASPGVLVLDYSGRGSFNIQGGGAFTEAGAAVVINSNNSQALVDTGTGTAIATEFDITGNLTVGSRATLRTAPTPNQFFEGVPPTADPLAYLPAPTPSGLGTITKTVIGSGSSRYNQYVLTPGQFGGPGPSLPNFTGADVVILTQASGGNGGVYYLNQGGLNFSGTTLRMDASTSGGVMLYNAGTGSNDKINITGSPGGTVNLSPLTTGPYQGISFFQARNATEDIQIAGNGTFSITGTLYAPNATLKITGNGGTASIGSQWIAKDVSVAGNGNVQLTYASGQVARTRIFGLVE